VDSKTHPDPAYDHAIDLTLAASTLDYPPRGLPIRQMRRALQKKRVLVATGAADEKTIRSEPLGPEHEINLRFMIDLMLKSMWFDLSGIKFSDLPLNEKGGFIGSENIIPIRLAEIEANPPAPAMLFLRQYAADDGSGKCVHCELVGTVADDKPLRLFARAFYDRKTKVWAIVPGEVENEHQDTEEYFQGVKDVAELCPYFALYMLVTDDNFTGVEADHHISTGKPTQESANPPEGTTYKIVHLSNASTERSEHLGGTHASPRKHWRRAHWRRLLNGDRIWIAGQSIGTDERGEVRHDYLVMPEIPQQE